MQSHLNQEQRRTVPRLLLYRLNQGGTSIDSKYLQSGDQSQIPYQDMPVWHKKKDLDEWIASVLHLPPELWGPKRISNTLMRTTSNEIAKLRKKGIIADWSSTRRTTLFRIVDGDSSMPMPEMSTASGKRQEPGSEQSMKKVFISIISRSRKDNTYKFALGKTLLDFCRDTKPTGRTVEIGYEHLAAEFLKHYWYQKYRFKMKQDFHVKRKPAVMKILEEVFEDNQEYKFGDLDASRVTLARDRILENVFGLARKKKGMVVQRFQRIRDGNTVKDANVFYDYDDDLKKIFLKPEAHVFFKENYGLLMRSLLAEWILYLERVNHGLPLLGAKIDNKDAKHGSLKIYRDTFLKYSNSCFYCNCTLRTDSIHVDHFIPWSYIFDDNAWNLVLACQECNLRKSSSLPRHKFVDYLIERDQDYQDREVGLMCKSLDRLSVKGPWRKGIEDHYRICDEYGFGMWYMGTKCT